ncbi:MAG: hypothetical protein CO189_10255 [candidate division Zixibacteria bacterium CG_4_9_14_3_um_filter_46_8]|nr:MAG: hypothetical protein CO189_10255 [candidate division Zixibacteria bacterium CG_4_9_14_3_um_filter_46_8]
MTRASFPTIIRVKVAFMSEDASLHNVAKDQYTKQMRFNQAQNALNLGMGRENGVFLPGIATLAPSGHLTVAC